MNEQMNKHTNEQTQANTKKKQINGHMVELTNK